MDLIFWRPGDAPLRMIAMTRLARGGVADLTWKQCSKYPMGCGQQAEFHNTDLLFKNADIRRGLPQEEEGEEGEEGGEILLYS